MLGYFEGNMARWALGSAHQRHIGFSWSAVTLFDVALQAGGHYVFPGIATTSGARKYMVDGEIMPTVTTILASVTISVKNVSTRKRDFFVWNLHI